MTATWVIFTPRVGSSMLMRMLHVGGLDVLADPKHSDQFPGEANVHGYYESAEIRDDAVAVLSQYAATGPYAVKIPVRWVGPLLEAGILPDRVLVPTRDRGDSMSSWRTFFGHIDLDWQTVGHNRELATKALEEYGIPQLELPYCGMLETPVAAAQSVAGFLGLPLDVEAMAAVPSWGHCHFRAGELLNSTAPHVPQLQA